MTRHLDHSEQGPGRVRRVTAAVVVNDRESTAGAGKAQHTVWVARSADEMHRLEQLAQAAVGFDEKRGDQVVMENVAFSSNQPESTAVGFARVAEQAKLLLASQPGLAKTLVLGGLGMLVVLFVLRPVAGQVVSVLREPAMLGAGAPLLAGAESAELTESVKVTQIEASDDTRPEPLPLPLRRQPRVEMNTAVYEQVAEHIKREPQQSTRLLQAWIGPSGEGE